MRSLAFVTAFLVTLLAPATSGHAAADWAWPVHGQVLTEFKNGDDPYAAGQHRGVDIGAPVGTPVVAAAAGTVVYAGVVGSSGLVVSERTLDGRYELSYLHLSAAAVRRGDSVGRGDRLGQVGVSGTRSVEQPHLHFGVREAGDHHAYLNPLDFLAPPPAATPDPAPAPVPVREPAAASPALAPAAIGPVRSALPLHAPAPHAIGHPAWHAPHAIVPSAAPHHFVAAGPHRVEGTRPQPSARHLPARPAVSAPGHGPVGVPAAARDGAPAARPASPHHGSGIDMGWLAACAGLVLAAALLAAPHPGAGRRPSARRTFGALMRAASRT